MNGSGLDHRPEHKEIDTLTGGDGSDIFVLGDKNGVFYLGEGYAKITDFTSDDLKGTDALRVSPLNPFTDYKIVEKGGISDTQNLTEIHFIGGGQDDLIAQITHDKAFTIDGSYVTF